MRKLALICGCSLFALGTALADGNVATSSQDGTGNTSSTSQTGSDNSASTSQGGAGNSSDTSQASSGNQASTSQEGSGNSAQTTQTGSGNNALSIQIGSSNSASINQYGDNDAAAIGQEGNNNSASITQSGAAGSNGVMGGGTTLTVGPGGMTVNGQTTTGVRFNGENIAFRSFSRASVLQYGTCTRAVYTHSSGTYRLIVRLGPAPRCQPGAQLCTVSASREPAICRSVALAAR